VEVAQIAHLQTDEGRRLLAETSAALATADEIAASERLRRRGHKADDIAAAMTQVRLRERAAAKLGEAAALLMFTPDGLEQATHAVVARMRAERLADAGRRSVIDLGCGIGSDLVSFARAGLRVTGVERDPVVAAVARANLAALGLDGVVEVADAVGYPTDGHDTAFVDPARRDSTGRVFDPDRYSPPWPYVDALIRGGAVAKVAPGIPHELVPDGAEAEWVSVAGQLREATLWPAELAGCARRATVVGSDGRPARLAGDAEPDSETEVETADVGGYLHEPDDAVVRAHLVAEFAATVDGWLIDPHLAYVSANEPRATPLGRSYRVIEALPYREKALRAALRARDIGALQIKKRGIAITPEELRARLRLRGAASATLVLTRTPHGARALLVEPLRGRE
jgi:SAM-dependent methyltransferase